ncbi:hypothetical protein ACIBG5_30860 [Kribbella sp. NPDC050241]|uniref:hypothetical protein n=1 Tax=Kribbella sp. NPDC050241 TaxID=3364115 RepID=UPI0037B33E8C
MIRDEELQSLIATSLDSNEVHALDPAEVARIANRRDRRDRRRKLLLVGLGAVGLVVSGVVVSVVYLGKDRGVTTTAPEPSASTRPPAGMRPGCAPSVYARLIGGVSGPGQDEFPILTRTHVGGATRTVVEVANVGSAARSSRVVLGYLAVARPGSRYGAGEGEGMPADSVVRAENQLVRSDPLVDIIPAGQRLSVTFQATQPGTYGVYFIARIAYSGDLCDGAPAPPPGTPAKGGMTQKIGDIIVR